MRRHAGCAAFALLVVTLVTPAASASASVRAEAPSASVPAIGPDDNPVGVPFETLSADASGAIRIDGAAAPGTTTRGNLNYAVISRTNRSVISSGSVPKTQAGVAQLAATAGERSDADLMVVSGTAGIDTAALPDFKRLAARLGASDTGLTSAMTDALTSQSAPFSVLGIPGGAAGTVWLNVGLVPADLPPSPPFVLPPKGDIIGKLQWNITTDQYDYADEQFPQFDTDVIDGTTPTNIMTFNGGDYPADVIAGTSGFHVLVVDSVTLRVLADQTLPTNGGMTPAATLQETFASQLAADAHMAGFQQFYASKQAPLVLMQSYGSPAGAGQAWQGASETVGELGGNHFGFLNLDADHSDFSLIGQVGGQAYAVGAARILGQAGPLSGVLTRTRTMAFEPAAAGPADGVNGQLLALAYQAPDPFKPFQGGQAAAAAYLGVQLHLCQAEAGCHVRQAYWSLYNAVTWSTESQRVGKIPFPGGETTFTPADLKAVATTLEAEFLDVQDVQDYFTKLASVFYSAQSHAVLDVKDIGKAVLDSVQPPNVDKTVSLLTFIARVAAVGGFAGPPASALAAGLSAAFSLGAFLVSASGKSTLPDKIQARTDQLSTELAARLGQTAANFDMIGRLIASDAGKLSEFQKVRLSPSWRLEPSSEPAKTAITKAARQWFAAALTPAATPFLAIAWNSSPNTLFCKFYDGPEVHGGRPWRNEPALAQFRAVIGYTNAQPVTQTIFFSKSPDAEREDNGPPESLAAFLFESPAGVRLNQYAFMSDANFGRTRNVVNDDFCFRSTRRQP